jgi:UV DNA damage repair endonuclease
MYEFNNRMDAQRKIIEMVNLSPKNRKEELCGLSKNAIERWLNINSVSYEGEIGILLFQISQKLFFLSNKSQEQVSDDYKLLSFEVQQLQQKLSTALKFECA